MLFTGASASSLLFRFRLADTSLCAYWGRGTTTVAGNSLRAAVQELGVGSNIVVCPLAKEGVVDADNLLLLGTPETESGDKVHGPKDDGGDDQGPRETCKSVGDLVSKLDVVVVEPTSWDDCDAVKASDGSLCKESSEDAADESSNSVRSKDVKCVVGLEEVLERSGQVAADGSDKANCNGSGGTDEPRGRSDADETCNDTRAESDKRKLALETPVHQHPGDTANCCCEVGNDNSLDCAEVGRECRTTVEAHPSCPEHDGANEHKGSVVRLVCEALSPVSPPLAEIQRDSESSGTTRDVDWCSTSKVETAHDERPASSIPCPAGNGAVDKRKPDKDEDENRSHPAPLSKCSDSNDDSDDGKHPLIDTEEERRHTS